MGFDMLKHTRCAALLPTFFLLLAGCVHQPAQKETVTLCDSSGCVERPRDYESLQTEDTSEEDQRIAALEEIARKDPRAAYDLGLRFFRGDGVRQDSYQAIRWMREAAEHGNLNAQKALGRLYLTGLEEMGSDPAEAEKWLMIAASRGDKESGKLLAEASAAKQSEQSYYTWKNRWRPVFYGYWYRSYPYYWGWRNGYWVPY